jgi:hypothetical protein
MLQKDSISSHPWAGDFLKAQDTTSISLVRSLAWSYYPPDIYYGNARDDPLSFLIRSHLHRRSGHQMRIPRSALAAISTARPTAYREEQRQRGMVWSAVAGIVAVVERSNE